MTHDPHNRSRGLPGSPGLNATADDLARAAQAQAPLPRPVKHAVATDQVIIAALIAAALANIASIVWR